MVALDRVTTAKRIPKSLSRYREQMEARRRARGPRVAKRLFVAQCAIVLIAWLCSLYIARDLISLFQVFLGPWNMLMLPGVSRQGVLLRAGLVIFADSLGVFVPPLLVRRIRHLGLMSLCVIACILATLLWAFIGWACVANKAF